MSVHRAMTIQRNGLGAVAQASIGGMPVFIMAYDRASREYETQWETDPLRERSNMLDAANMFLWYFSDKVAFAGLGHEAKTVPANDLYDALLPLTDGMIQLYTPIARLDIGDTMMTCRARDELVLPLTNLITQTGYGRWNEEFNGLTIDRLDSDAYRPLDLAGSLRMAYRLLR